MAITWNDPFTPNFPAIFRRNLLLKTFNNEQQGILLRGSEATRRFETHKSKEIDSGVLELETPDNITAPVAGPRRPSSALSVLSAPPTSPSSTFSDDNSSDSVASILTPPSSTRSPSPPDRISSSVDWSRAHNATAVLLNNEIFRWAQRKYTAAGTLFVGNLPAGYTDLEIIRALTEIFSGFAPAYIRVDRHYTSSHVKPYAIVQLTLGELADSAVADLSRNRQHIAGRPIRVELSSARRSLDVIRVDHLRSSDLELVKSFGQFGAFKCARFPTGKIYIEYKTYGGFLDAKKALEGKVGLLGAWRYAF